MIVSRDGLCARNDCRRPAEGQLRAATNCNRSDTNPAVSPWPLLSAKDGGLSSKARTVANTRNVSCAAAYNGELSGLVRIEGSTHPRSSSSSCRQQARLVALCLRCVVGLSRPMCTTLIYGMLAINYGQLMIAPHSLAKFWSTTKWILSHCKLFRRRSKSQIPHFVNHVLIIVFLIRHSK